MGGTRKVFVYISQDGCLSGHFVVWTMFLFCLFRHDDGRTLVLSVVVRVALSDVDVLGTFYVQQQGTRPSCACQAYMSGVVSLSQLKSTHFIWRAYDPKSGGRCG